MRNSTLVDKFNLPINWKIKTLEELTYQVIDGTHHTPTYTKYGVPFLRVTDVQKKVVDFSSIKYVSESEHKQLIKRCKPQQGDILLSKNGTVGIAKVVDWDWDFSIFVSLALIKLKPALDSIFVSYFLSSNLTKWQIKRRAKQGTVTNLHLEEIREFEIPQLPLPQQKKIAKILSTCDAVIEKTEAAIAKYQAIKQGMMHDLFTRGIDLATGKLRPTPQQAPELYKDSELGKIPKEWEVKKLSNLTEVKVSNVDKKIHQGKTLVRLCNYMDVYSNQFITNNMDFMIGSADINEKARFSLKPQDVIITKDSETPEDIAIPSVVIEDLENVVCGYHLAIFSPKQNILNGEFLMYNFMLSSTQRYFFKIASGSTRYGLTIGGIQAATFSIPKFTEQIEIKTRLRIIDDRLSTEEESLKKYQKIKQGLMQDLLTGKVAV